MTYENLPKNLPDLLRKAGLKVIEIDGWEGRGRPASTGGFDPVGFLNHHTGSRDVLGDFADDLAYARWLALSGRIDLPAPLVQLSLSLEGTVYVLAAGRCNHAGVAKASGSVAGGDGNSLYVGMEWMLSGTQPIPKAMYDAGAKVNAVVLKVLGSSVQAVSCHYQTSVTGKWDIGDPSGIPFGSARVLNVPKFREAVKTALAKAEPPKPEGSFVDLDVMHASMQFSDSPKQMKQDVGDLFDRARQRKVWWLTGTEAGPGADPLSDLLGSMGKAAGFRVFTPARPTDCWVAVSNDRIDGGWETSYDPLIPGSSELYRANGNDPGGFPRWGPKGVVAVHFDNKDLGSGVGVGAGHYLTKGRKPGDVIKGVDHFALNTRLADGIGDWAREAGKGRDLAFYGGDQNVVDRTEDTFFGSPLTSAWDELDKYENTGHGSIDVIASYDHDGRVEARYIRALDDSEFAQNSDHFVIEAGYRVKALKAA